MGMELNQSEPTLREILEDPIMLAVLKRDGLTVEDVKKVVSSYRRTAKNPLIRRPHSFYQCDEFTPDIIFYSAITPGRGMITD